MKGDCKNLTPTCTSTNVSLQRTQHKCTGCLRSFTTIPALEQHMKDE